MNNDALSPNLRSVDPRDLCRIRRYAHSLTPTLHAIITILCLFLAEKLSNITVDYKDLVDREIITAQYILDSFADIGTIDQGPFNPVKGTHANPIEIHIQRQAGDLVRGAEWERIWRKTDHFLAVKVTHSSSGWVPDMKGEFMLFTFKLGSLVNVKHGGLVWSIDPEDTQKTLESLEQLINKRGVEFNLVHKKAAWGRQNTKLIVIRRYNY